MLRLVLLILLLGAGVVASSAAPTGSVSGETPSPESEACTCSEAERTNGWCRRHGIGYVAAVPIRSARLYDVLDAHGHAVDLSTFECESCKRAIATGGFCEEDRVGFVGKLAYFSRLTYELARGERTDPGSLSCPVCTRHDAEGPGWCETCKRGMVGHVAIRDKQAYEAAARAVAILRAAVEASERCEHCAVAIVTDTKCPYCRITYKDGKPVP